MKTKTFKPLPKYLYKYICYTNNESENITYNKRLREILLDGKLYYSSPSQFNDPFDTKINVQFKGDADVRRKYFRKILSQRYPQSSKSGIQKKLNKIDPDFYNSDEFDKTINKTLFETSQQHRIFCLSEEKENILLWSHYAANHEGLCLQFSTEKSAKWFNKAVPMEYQRKYPLIDIYKLELNEAVDVILRTKFLKWKYEREWRLFNHGGPHFFFPPNQLKGIIFGLNMSSQNRKKITNYLGQMDYKPEVYEAIRKPNSFSLRIIKYKA